MKPINKKTTNKNANSHNNISDDTAYLQQAYGKNIKILPDQKKLTKAYICVGPGSYVGIRESISLIKGISVIYEKVHSKKLQIICFSLIDLALDTVKNVNAKKSEENLDDHQTSNILKDSNTLVILKAWPRDKIKIKEINNNLDKIRVYVCELKDKQIKLLNLKQLLEDLNFGKYFSNLSSIEKTKVSKYKIITNIPKTIKQLLSNCDIINVNLNKKYIPNLSKFKPINNLELKPIYN